MAGWLGGRVAGRVRGSTGVITAPIATSSIASPTSIATLGRGKRCGTGGGCCRRCGSLPPPHHPTLAVPDIKSAKSMPSVLHLLLSLQYPPASRPSLLQQLQQKGLHRKRRHPPRIQSHPPHLGVGGLDERKERKTRGNQNGENTCHPHLLSDHLYLGGC